MRVAPIALLFVVAGCGDLALENGKLPCSLDGKCPEQYLCQSDHHCWLPGTGPTSGDMPASAIDLSGVSTNDGGAMLDGASPDGNVDGAFDFAPIDAPLDSPGPGDAALLPDLSMPDLTPVIKAVPPAAVWVSSGGGTSATNMGMFGPQLNICIGGAIAPGTISPSSGGSATVSTGYFAADTIP